MIQRKRYIFYRATFFGLAWILLFLSASVCRAQEHTLIVEYFDPGSMARRAGVIPGDSVLSYNERPLISPAALQAAEENTFGKKSVALRVEREGQILRFIVPPGPLGMAVSILLPDEARMLYIQSWRELQSENFAGGLNKTQAAAKLMQDQGDYLAAAWVWWTQGNRLERLEKLPEAQQAYRTALDLLGHTSDVAARSRALSSLGNCNVKLNALTKALEWYEKALQVDSAEGYEWWVAGDLTQIANSALARADLDVARNYNSRAFRIYERLAPDSIYLAGVLNNLGEIALAYGDLRLAQTNFTAALRIKQNLPDEPLNLLSLAGTISNLAGVALARNDLKSSLDYLKTSLEIREKFLPSDSSEIAANLVNLGNVYQAMGDLTIAEADFNKALAIYKGVGPKTSAYAGALSNLGNIAYDRNNLRLAQEYHSRASAILGETVPDSLDVGKALVNLGNTFYALHDRDAARKYYTRALAIYRRLAPSSLDLALTLNSLGVLALSESHFAEARSLFGDAVSIIEDQRRQITSVEARAFLVGERLSEYTGLLRAYVGLDNVPAAFETVERARARSLAEMLYERSLESPESKTKELGRKELEIIEQRNAAYYKLSKLDPQKDQAEIESLRARIEELVLRQRRLIAEIREEAPQYAALQYPQPQDLIKTQAALDQGTLLLSYFVDEKQTYLFSITKSDVKLYQIPIGKDDLRGLVSNFQARLANQGIRYREPSRQLYKLLIQPAQVELEKATRVLVSPDGPLHTLAFAALEDPSRSQSAPPESKPYYLIQAKPIHTIVSMTVYTELRKRKPNLTSNESTVVLALGDPVYNGAQIVVGCGKRSERLEPLPDTRNQVEAIAKLYGKQAVLALDKDANSAVLASHAPKASILHFACHGIVEACDPYASALALTPKDDRGDGLLRAYEIIERLSLNADLVTLSACRTGEGEESKSEGIIGLTRAFQYAGAKSVLVSLWRIREDSTTRLMEKFYRLFRDNQSKDEALRQAQLSLISSAQYSHPYFWAAFVLTGDWQ